MKKEKAEKECAYTPLIWKKTCPAGKEVVCTLKTPSTRKKVHPCFHVVIKLPQQVGMCITFVISTSYFHMYL